LTEGRGDDHRGAREPYAGRAEERGTSWISVILGLLTALGAGLILSGIVGGIVGAILGTGGARQAATEGGASGLVGLLITLLLAFLIGGYAAFRMASRSGLKHGLLVALLISLGHGGLGAIGSGHRDKPHKLQWNYAAGSAVRRATAGPAESRRYPDRGRHPRPAPAVRRGRHRRRLGRQDRPQAGRLIAHM